MFGREKNKQAKGLNIIIVGCGKVGYTIIEKLIDEGHDITVIDQNPQRITDVCNAYDVYGIVGNGASFHVQTEAGVEHADVFIAVTPTDELNLLCCLMAKRSGQCEVIARVRTPVYSAERDYLKEQLGLALIINPDLEAANAIYRNLYIPTALSVNTFARGKAEMVRIKLPVGNVLVGKKIMELTQELSGAVLICAVERNHEVIIPNGMFEFLAGDEVTFIAPVRNGKSFLKKIGFHTHPMRDTILIGGGRTAYYLAHQLLEEGIAVTVVERNRKRCDELSELLPKAVVIHGDGMNQELLKEIGIEGAHSVITLTNSDEENIMLALHAQEVSDAKIITKVNRINFHSVIDRLNLGSMVYPKYITAEAIIAVVRSKKASLHGNIETLVRMFEGRAEAIEFYVREESAVTNIPLYQLPLKKDLLITCINRNGQIIIPGGNDEIRTGDSVIVVTTHLGFRDLTDIIR